MDDIPWSLIQDELKGYLSDIDLTVTICKSLVRTPAEHERQNLIYERHATKIGGHKGVTKTYNRLRQNFYWPNMKDEIQKYIQNCRDCQIKKLTRVKTRQPMTITDTPKAAFDKISMDIMGPLPITPTGHAYVLTIQDLLTKYSVAVPLRQTDSTSIALALVNHFICIYGAPKALLTDQAPNFFTTIMKEIAKYFKITHYRTTAYRPQSNGSLERSHHVLTEYLKMYTNSNSNWDEQLPAAMLSYNTSVHEGTGYTPYALVFGKIPRIPSSVPILEEEEADITYQTYLEKLYDSINEQQREARDRLIKAKERSKKYYDRRQNEQTYKQGDWVYLLKEPVKGKLADQYTGPHEIIELLPPKNAKIRYRGATRVVHTDKLKLSRAPNQEDPG